MSDYSQIDIVYGLMATEGQLEPLTPDRSGIKFLADFVLREALPVGQLERFSRYLAVGLPFQAVGFRSESRGGVRTFEWSGHAAFEKMPVTLYRGPIEPLVKQISHVCERLEEAISQTINARQGLYNYLGRTSQSSEIILYLLALRQIPEDRRARACWALISEALRTEPQVVLAIRRFADSNQDLGDSYEGTHFKMTYQKAGTMRMECAGQEALSPSASIIPEMRRLLHDFRVATL